MKEKIKYILGRLVFYTKDVIIHFPNYAIRTYKTLVIFSSFFIILMFFMMTFVINSFKYVPLISIIVKKIEQLWNLTLNRLYLKIYEKLESLRPFKIKRKYLIYVAMQNLNMRRSRSLITILGMSVGVGIIVFLLSLGYGIEKLVISQVASLQELQMVDVSAGGSSTASLTRKAFQRIKQIQEVKEIIPMISVVGRLNYKNAKTDILVYAVPKSYLEASKTEVTGKYFTQKDVDFITQNPPVVAGESVTVTRATYDTPITQYKVYLSPLPGEEVPVWKECDIQSSVIGTTTRTEITYDGMEYWGSEYAPLSPYGRIAYDEKREAYLGKWIKGEFPIFEHKSKDELVPKLGNTGVQEWQQGCIQRKNIQIIDEIRIKGSVLGEATESASLTATESASFNTDSTSEASASASLDETSGYVVATNSAGIEVVSLDKNVSPEKKENLLKFKSKTSGEAIISTALLKLLDIPETKAKGSEFKISFIIIRSLMPSIQGRILTEEVVYRVIGVVNDEDNQFIYIPINDINVLGVSNYSQAKLVLSDANIMPDVRKKVESMGFKTSSTVDTIAQIQTFFNGLRVILGILGFIALAVASLGMFNTLTVSLLERTREIGGMKTMGMVSGEIQELFLAEAMIMGLGGGIGGILLGFLVGKMLSNVVSIFAIAQGVGYLELTYIPFSLILFIILSSFIIGLVTGLYPSYRAKKISALNALRYE